MSKSIKHYIVEPNSTIEIVNPSSSKQMVLADISSIVKEYSNNSSISMGFEITEQQTKERID